MKKVPELKDLIIYAMDSLDVAVTIIDSDGILLYYNHCAAETLDRKPEYLRNDVFKCHKEASSNEKLMSMIRNFQNGRTRPFRYQAKPYGQAISVTLSPIFEDGKFVGCIQSVIPVEDFHSK